MMGSTTSTRNAPPTAPTEDSFAAISKEEFGYTQARHLLLRAGFGGTDHQIRTLVSWGPEKAVDHIVDYQDIPSEPAKLDAFDHNIIRPYSDQERLQVTRARQRSDEDTLARFRTMRVRAQQADRRQMTELQRWWLTRMIQTPRPLEEKMTLFWHGHFATSYRVVEDSFHMYLQNIMFRNNALGNVGNLILGILQDPAMLKYLNNNQNRKNAPNENLARELLELFSLGEGHYTERDIKEAARALTGFTYEDDTFVFEREAHDTSTKRVLGATGSFSGEELVRVILRQKACAEFLCTKLYRFFVRDIPFDLQDSDATTRKTVLTLANMLRRTNYELRPFMKKLFLSKQFYDEANIGTMIKSPSDLLIGAVRSLQVPVRDMGTMSSAMQLMGQSLFMPPSVKGWDGGRSWINTSTMFIRQNLLVYMLTGQLPTSRRFALEEHEYDARSLVSSLVDPDVSDPSDSAVARELSKLTLGQEDEETIKHVVQGASGRLTQREPLQRALVLLTSMPGYQLS